MTPQYYDTKCLICETTIHAPVENYVCNTCHNDDYSTVADFIVKQNARIAALEAQNKKLVEALTSVTRLLEVSGMDDIGGGIHTTISTARALLSEVAQ